MVNQKTELNKNGRRMAKGLVATRLHAAIELCYLGTLGNDKCDKDSQEWKHFQSFQNECKLVPYRSEWKIWSSEHKLAGTIDMLVNDGADDELFYLRLETS